ncbi:MAG: type II/IV secretion system protein [Phycisphaerae bacterium]|nr:type II/IV secretion system protein [Phycisphaerae bacterium]
MKLIDLEGFIAAGETASELWERLVEAAVHNRASDIHLAWQADGLHVALRLDGQLTPQGRIASVDESNRLINHVLVMAALDVGERRRPQAGRAMAKVDDRGIDLRVSVLPTNHGRDVVVRVLDRTVSLLEIEALGLPRRELNRLLGLVSAPSGLVLITGPTGAGKTTTLYATLNRLNDGTRKIVTIEEPIEYDLNGINQAQVNYRIGVDYASLLRTVLQQDPNIIMIGEVRDAETAATAVRAAVTGHLVFATLHAIEASAAVETLISLGAHPHFLGRALRGVVAQTLVRRLCPKCAERIDETEAVLPLDDVRELIGPDEKPALSMGRGCEHCHGSGYSGRMGLFEILVVTDELRRLIEERQPTAEIQAAAARTGMWTLQQVGKLAALRGETTIEELVRILPT